jgi:glutamyl-tRNA synthetase
MVKGKVAYEGSYLSDPVVIREDGSMTYMLCSTIDDIDYNISHIIRGEDHVTNTAIQVQMFEALDASAPQFGHLSLVKAKDDKISKRIGGFEIATLRDELGLEPMAILDFFTFIGSSKAVLPFAKINDLINEFDITTYSKSPTIYQPLELERINHKIIIALSFDEIKDRIIEIGLNKLDEQFWLAVRPNLQKLNDLKDWWMICHELKEVEGLDKEFLNEAAELFPEGKITTETWSKWTNAVSAATGKKGKELFMPLRLALTSMEHGPELKNILPLIGREEILRRLK